MRAEEARQALAGIGLRPASVAPILGGWAFFTFDLDGEWIARFPRNDETAEAARRELRLLPELAEHVPFAVPRPEYVGAVGGKPFFVYRRVPGRELRASDRSPSLPAELSSMLASLHAFPVERAEELLGTGPAQGAWRQRFESLREIVEREALPVLPPDLAVRVDQGYERFLAQPFDVPSCLVHNDLGPEHVLIDPVGGRPVGIIDFESAWVGDPAIDLVPLVALFGSDTVDAFVGGRDLGDRLLERLWFYRWMGSVHAVIYGVREDLAGERAGGIRELRRRLDSPFG